MDITTPTGAKASIKPAPFGVSMALKNAIFRELASTGVSIDVKSLKADTEIGLDKIIAAFMVVDSAPAVYKAVMDCLSRCTYNSEKITEHTFDNEQAREDWYPVVIQCVKVNLLPFGKGLASGLNEAGKLTDLVNRK